MLEIIFLIVVVGAIVQTTRRRGGSLWVAVPVSLVGYLVFAGLGQALFGMLGYFAGGFGWLGLCYLALFYVYGRGRTLATTWRCPDCLQFNERTTIVCDCGHRPESEPA